MHYYSSSRPFGRDLSLILNDRDEVEDYISGPGHEEIAERLAEDWSEMFRDVGGEG